MKRKVEYNLIHINYVQLQKIEKYFFINSRILLKSKYKST